jgi:hypothetical protein
MSTCRTRRSPHSCPAPAFEAGQRSGRAVHAGIVKSHTLDAATAVADNKRLTAIPFARPFGVVFASYVGSAVYQREFHPFEYTVIKIRTQLALLRP